LLEIAGGDFLTRTVYSHCWWQHHDGIAAEHELITHECHLPSLAVSVFYARWCSHDWIGLDWAVFYVPANTV